MIPLPIGLYNLLQAPVLAAYLPWAALSPRRRRALPARLGIEPPRVEPGGLWVHALSLGEVISARPLLLELKKARPDLDLILSATTDSGLAAAEKEVAAGRARAAFRAPLDLFPALGRVLGSLRPQGLILVETDIWPNLLWSCRRRSIPTALVNFRISPARDKGHRRLRAFFAAAYGLFAAVALPTELDRERWERIGVRGSEAGGPSIRVTGSLKYDQPPPVPASPGDYGLDPARPALIAGSTHPGEESIVLEAWAALRREIPEAALILAPRNLERMEEVAGLIQARGIEPARLSRGQGLKESPVLLVDVLGRLAALYGLVRAAFVGGSLVPRGGHNVLEPAALGVPVCFGPHMDNFAAEARRLSRAKGGTEVADSEALAAFWRSMLLDREAARAAGEAAGEVVRGYRGAAKRSVELIGEAFGW